LKSLNKVDKHTLNIDKTTYINFVASSKPVTGMNRAYYDKSVQEANTQESLGFRINRFLTGTQTG
jgi:hypothetical protein